MDLNQIAKALGPRSSEMHISISFPRAWEGFQERRIVLTINEETYVLTMQQYKEVLEAALDL